MVCDSESRAKKLLKISVVSRQKDVIDHIALIEAIQQPPRKHRFPRA